MTTRSLSLDAAHSIVATPVFYTLLDDAAAWLGTRFRRGSAVYRGEAEIGVRTEAAGS